MPFEPGGTFTCDNCEISVNSVDTVGSWINVRTIGNLDHSSKYFCSPFCYIQFIMNPMPKDDDSFTLPKFSIDMD